MNKAEMVFAEELSPGDILSIFETSDGETTTKHEYSTAEKRMLC